ncbi:MAG: universal stress protein [Rhodovibrionaceae bacterium]
MAMTSILAVVDGGSGSEALLKGSFALARKLQAYLEVLHVEPDPRDALPVVGEGMTGTLVEQVSADIEARREAALKAARSAFEAQCEAFGVEAKSADGSRSYKTFGVAWTQVQGREDEFVADLGRFFDLIAVAHPGGDEGSAYAPALEAGLFQCGRPVLVLPKSGPDFPGDKAAIAWNGSREAVRAITAAMPLLEAAKSVQVISIDGDGEAAALERLSAFLAGHGIEPKYRKLSAGNSEVGSLLLREAQDCEASLVVMGAYGHSRLREFVLGGATRSVLHESSVALLLAH